MNDGIVVMVMAAQNHPIFVFTVHLSRDVIYCMTG